MSRSRTLSSSSSSWRSPWRWAPPCSPPAAAPAAAAASSPLAGAPTRSCCTSTGAPSTRAPSTPCAPSSVSAGRRTPRRAREKEVVRRELVRREARAPGRRRPTRRSRPPARGHGRPARRRAGADRGARDASPMTDAQLRQRPRRTACCARRCRTPSSRICAPRPARRGRTTTRTARSFRQVGVGSPVDDPGGGGADRRRARWPAARRTSVRRGRAAVHDRPRGQGAGGDMGVVALRRCRRRCARRVEATPAGEVTQAGAGPGRLVPAQGHGRTSARRIQPFSEVAAGDRQRAHPAQAVRGPGGVARRGPRQGHGDPALTPAARLSRRVAGRGGCYTPRRQTLPEVSRAERSHPSRRRRCAHPRDGRAEQRDRLQRRLRGRHRQRGIAVLGVRGDRRSRLRRRSRPRRGSRSRP